MQFLLLFSVFAAASSYKMVIIGPTTPNSQMLYYSRVGEALADAGHDVSIAYISKFPEKEERNVKVDPRITVNMVNASISASLDLSEMEKTMSEGTFKDEDPIKGFAFIGKFAEMFASSCRATLRNKEFLHWLESEKFDLAFVHMYHACPLGFVHAAKIPAHIWISGGGLFDNVAPYVGQPIIPSYMPPMMMEAHDRMNFIERTKSVIGHVLTTSIWPGLIADPETQIYREEIDPNFPDLLDLARKTPLIMLNSNELYELPRPTLAKIVSIGGVGYQMKEPKPLAPEFQTIIDKAKGIIIFSFGSVAPAHLMPESWKTALLAAFGRFPDYHFVMRYKEKDLDDRLPANVHAFKWMPQADLLQNNKTLAIITHGGYNSLQESISAGVPLMTIALKGDQPKNAKIALKHGIAVNIKKSEVTEQAVYAAIREIIDNKTYKESAKRLSKMVAHQPFSAREKLVRWAEFVAEFKTLDNLQPAGIHLSTIQYYSLDVLAFLSFISLIALLIVYKILMFIVKFSLRLLKISSKAKTD